MEYKCTECGRHEAPCFLDTGFNPTGDEPLGKPEYCPFGLAKCEWRLIK